MDVRTIGNFSVRREDLEVQRPDLMSVVMAEMFPGYGHSCWCTCPVCFPCQSIFRGEVTGMGITKHGHGEILREPEEPKQPKTATSDPEREKRLARLDEENTEADK